MILYTVQVDIAPTLALLFGVPIPKNNVGVLISEAFDLLTGQFSLSLSVSFVYACSGTWLYGMEIL